MTYEYVDPNAPINPALAGSTIVYSPVKRYSIANPGRSLIDPRSDYVTAEDYAAIAVELAASKSDHADDVSTLNEVIARGATMGKRIRELEAALAAALETIKRLDCQSERGSQHD
jgi:hypothetical protein